jgi:hypothetical protein
MYPLPDLNKHTKKPILELEKVRISHLRYRTYRTPCLLNPLALRWHAIGILENEHPVDR